MAEFDEAVCLRKQYWPPKYPAIKDTTPSVSESEIILTKHVGILRKINTSEQTVVPDYISKLKPLFPFPASIPSSLDEKLNLKKDCSDKLSTM